MLLVYVIYIFITSTKYSSNSENFFIVNIDYSQLPGSVLLSVIHIPWVHHMQIFYLYLVLFISSGSMLEGSANSSA